MDNSTDNMQIDTRCVAILESAMRDGLFTAREISLAEDKVLIEKEGTQTTCSGFFVSDSGVLGAVNIVWDETWSSTPYSIFAYSGDACTLKPDVTVDDLCAKCFQINQDLPLSNAYFRIDEPEKFKDGGSGFIVCIAGLPLLPFEADVNYQKASYVLEMLLVGAMESAFDGEKLIRAYFGEYIE